MSLFCECRPPCLITGYEISMGRLPVQSLLGACSSQVFRLFLKLRNWNRILLNLAYFQLFWLSALGFWEKDWNRGWQKFVVFFKCLFSLLLLIEILLQKFSSSFRGDSRLNPFLIWIRKETQMKKELLFSLTSSCCSETKIKGTKTRCYYSEAPRKTKDTLCLGAAWPRDAAAGGGCCQSRSIGGCPVCHFGCQFSELTP